MMKNFAAFALEPREHEVRKFRKHWFVLLRDTLGTALAALLPALALVLAASAGVEPIPIPLVVFATLWWLLLVWLTLVVIWTNYYLDLWLITDKRVVSIDQTGLFHREVTTLSLAGVQDVTTEQQGIIQTLLNFGSLTVQNAGPTTNNMTIRGVARPAEIKHAILKQCEFVRRHNLTYRASGTPTSSLPVPPSSSTQEAKGK